MAWIRSSLANGGGGSSAGLIFTLMVITSAAYTATDLPVTS